VQPLSQPAAAIGKKYVRDITHYLDETGELVQLPGPSRRLGSFLTLLIEAATGASSAGGVVAFLCSDAGRWVNAQRLEVSGGMFL